jgi:hypothetical protein
MNRPAARAMSSGIVTLQAGDAVIIMAESHSADRETERRFNETVRNLLSTPHKPHKDKGDSKPPPQSKLQHARAPDERGVRRIAKHVRQGESGESGTDFRIRTLAPATRERISWKQAPCSPPRKPRSQSGRAQDRD